MGRTKSPIFTPAEVQEIRRIAQTYPIINLNDLSDVDVDSAPTYSFLQFLGSGEWEDILYPIWLAQSGGGIMTVRGAPSSSSNNVARWPDATGTIPLFPSNESTEHKVVVSTTQEGELQFAETATGLAQFDIMGFSGSGWVNASPDTWNWNQFGNVTLTTEEDGQMLLYNDIAGEWKNEGGTADGQVPVWDESGGTGFNISALSYNSLTSKPTIPNELNDLDDVIITTPMDGEVLTYSSGDWVNAAASGGAEDLDDLTDVDSSSRNASTRALLWNNGAGEYQAEAFTFNNLDDVTGSPSAGAFPVWSGSSWILTNISTNLLRTNVSSQIVTGNINYRGNDALRLSNTSGVPTILFQQPTNTALTDLYLPEVSVGVGNVFMFGATTASSAAGQLPFSTSDADIVSWATPSLSDLDDIDLTGQATGDLLRYDGADYVPDTLELDDLEDVDTTTTAPTTGDLLQYDGADWVPADITTAFGTTWVLIDEDTLSVDGDIEITGLAGDDVIEYRLVIEGVVDAADTIRMQLDNNGGTTYKYARYDVPGAEGSSSPFHAFAADRNASNVPLMVLPNSEEVLLEINLHCGPSGLTKFRWDGCMFSDTTYSSSSQLPGRYQGWGALWDGDEMNVIDVYMTGGADFVAGTRWQLWGRKV